MEHKENKQIEEKIVQAFAEATPHNLDAILADCQKKKGKETQMKKNFAKITSAVAAAFVLMIGCILAIQLIGNTSLTTVAIDVNPSIELSLDQNEKVVSVSAVNGDAAAIIEDLSLEGKKLEDAVKAIVTSMIEQGYISELANSILVSVDGNNEKSAALRDKLTSIIKDILDDDAIEGAILSQTHTPDDEIKALAEKYNISTGKAAIISRLVAADGTHLFEELVGLSINELNILLEKVNSSDKALKAQGSASTKAYIDKDTALAAALDDLGITRNDAKGIEIDLDYEHGMMVYEIEFKYGTNEYEYEISATDASVIRIETDTDDSGDDKDDDDDDIPPTEIITEADAKKAALADAAVNAEDVLSFRTELDEDDNIWYYEVDFKTASAKYEYEIDAANGNILNKKIKALNSESGKGDNDDDNNDDDDDNDIPTEAVITEDEAKQIALSDALINEEDAKAFEIELDEDDGVWYYEIEFKANGFEYEYKVSAMDKSIIHSEKDKD